MKKLLRFFTVLLALLTSFVMPSSININSDSAEPVFNNVKNANYNTRITKNKKIFYMSSYSLDWFSVSNQINGFLEGLTTEAKIDYYFLDAHNKDMSDLTNKEITKDDIIATTKDNKYDLIIASDDEAVQYLNYVYPLVPAFEGAPILFHGVDYSYTASKAIQNDAFQYINGIMEAVDFESLLRTANALIPEAKRVNFIYENTYVGGEQKGSFMTSYKNLVNEKYGSFRTMEEPNYINVDEYTRGEFANIIKGFKPNELTIFGFASKDFYGNPYDYRDIIKIFKQNLSSPAFCINNFGIGECFVGGKVYSHYLGGKLIGSWADEILNLGYEVFDKNHPSDDQGIYVPNDELMYNKFDGILIKQYNLDVGAIPQGSNTIILNEKEVLSFFYQYRDILVPTIIGLSLFFAAAIWILWLYGKEREKNKIISNDRKKLEYLASHDFLTGLRTRQFFSRKIAEYFDRKQPFFLIVMDIDGFKYINDTYGHLIGDEALIRCAKYFKSLTTDSIKVYRVGGDEFIFTVKTSKRDDVVNLVEKLRNSEINKFTYKEHQIELTFSMGISQYPYDGLNEVDLVDSADSALYYIKEHGKNNYAFYDKSRHDSLAEIGVIEREIKSALANEGFTLNYQPEIDIATGRVLSYEALIRFKSKMISPKDFIKITEKNGLIIDIGRYVLTETAYFLERMRQKFGKMVPVSVNFSFSQLKEKDFLDKFKDMMFELDIPLSLIKFEISEYSLKSKPDSLEYFVDFARKNDLELVLDRFGASLSSINILQNPNLHTVKFDRDAITTLIDGRISSDAVKSIIKFLHSFDVKVCAVGIETVAQYEKLKECGCDSIQGFLFEKPIDEETVYKKFGKAYKLKK